MYKLNVKTNCNVILNPAFSKEEEGDVICYPFEPETMERKEEGPRGLFVEAFHGNQVSPQAVQQVQTINGGTVNQVQTINGGTVNIANQTINMGNNASNIQIGDVYQEFSDGSFTQVINGVSTEEGEEEPTLYIMVPKLIEVNLELRGFGSFDSRKVDLGNTEIEASGSCSICTGRLGDTKLHLVGSHSCDVTVGGDLGINSSGSSSVIAKGNGNHLMVESSGSSQINLYYECRHSKYINTSGSSKVHYHGSRNG
jgi:hypothetical protein